MCQFHGPRVFQHRQYSHRYCIQSRHLRYQGAKALVLKVCVRCIRSHFPREKDIFVIRLLQASLTQSQTFLASLRSSTSHVVFLILSALVISRMTLRIELAAPDVWVKRRTQRVASWPSVRIWKPSTTNLHGLMP